MKTSAGLLMYQKHNDVLEFFLIHPGGPLWSRKNEGAWSIPKGLAEDQETVLETAQREFFEETGITPIPPFHDLGNLKTKGGKLIFAWAFEGVWNVEDGITSNMISIEYPYKSGKFITIPEADRAEWMTLEKASVMINPSQQPFLTRCVAILNNSVDQD